MLSEYILPPEGKNTFYCTYKLYLKYGSFRALSDLITFDIELHLTLVLPRRITPTHTTRRSSRSLVHNESRHRSSSASSLATDTDLHLTSLTRNRSAHD